VPIIKLGKTVDELTLTVRDLRREHVAKTSVTVDETNQLLASTNVQMQRVDAITSNAQTLTGNAAAMSSLFAATLGGPLVRTAAFTYGVRRALSRRRDRRGRRAR
jgi:ABC-type transporter Mla subunit MlaD